MLKYDVICVGSATLDHFLTVHQKLSSLTYGTKVLVRHLETHTGGGGSNAAVALARFGLKVAYLGKLSHDKKSQIIEKEFQKNKIKILNRKKSKLPTDEAFILNSEQEKDRIAYIHKGASEDLSLKEIPQKLFARWFYLGTLIGKAFPVLVRLSAYAQKNQSKVLFNPSTYLARQGLRKLKPILKNTDFLVLNKEEAKLILRTRENNIFRLLNNLKSHIKGSVVITNGPRCLYALHQEKIYSLLPPRIKVVHTAGAGDAFNSALLAALIKNYPFAEALKISQANASSVIQHLGTKNKLLNEREASQLAKKYKIKVVLHPL